MGLLTAAWLAPNATESAVANGDTRTIRLSNSHTNEAGDFTYLVNGVYDSGVLDKLNWLMRDWRLNEPTKMDPHLFDIIWEVYRESGSGQPIDVLSAYRSPQTNAMLRRRSHLVAQYSQHMEGKAIDAHFLDVSTARIRDVAMRMQAGGVGFYPTGATPWVHIDSGSVRYWPRMSRDALARLFPDGKTVFIPADGQPMPGFDQARAEIEARGGDIQVASSGGGGGPFALFAALFGARGGGADDAEEAGGQAFAQVEHGGKFGAATRLAMAQTSAPPPDPIATAKRDLPSGETFASAAAVPAPPSPQADKPEAAALDQPAASEAPAVKLHGPLAALYLAPLPPRRPADLAAVDAPLPPARPTEFAFAPPPPTPVQLAMNDAPARTSGASTARDDDLIAGLLRRGGLPRVITRGVRGGAPASALSLAETPSAVERRDFDALLARAAALNAPLPPVKAPAKAETTTVKRIRPAASSPGQAMLPKDGGAEAAASPAQFASVYGGLPLDAFKTPTPSLPLSASELEGLRGPAP